MPVPTDLKVEKREGSNFEPLPDDVYTAQLIDIELEEKPSYNDKNKMEKVFNFIFAILDQDFRGRWMSRGFVPTYLYIGKKGKNALYEILEALKGSTLTEEEEAYMGGEFINAQIRKQVRLVVKTKEKGDKKYSNIESFMHARTQLTPFTVEEIHEMLSKREESKNKKEEEQPQQEIDAEAVFNQPTEEELNAELAAKKLGGKVVSDDEIPVIQ
jgi:hypothetical protein